MKDFKYSWQQIAKASFVGIATTATFYLAKTTGLFSSWLSNDESQSALTDEIARSHQLGVSSSDALETASMARRLLQQNLNLTITGSVPDQIVQINQPYLYSLSDIFSSNYSFILGATQTGKTSLPAWLSFQPELLSTYPAGIGTTYSVATSDSTAFVISTNVGLQVLNVSDPKNISLLSTYPGSVFNGVAVSGSTVFVSDYSSGLRVFNASNLKNLTLLSTFSMSPWKSYGVTVSGLTAFVANYYSTNNTVSLQVLDWSNPRNLSLLSTYIGPGTSAYVTAISGSTVFAANGVRGLRVLDASNLQNLTLLSTFPSGVGVAIGVAVSGSTVFVADVNYLQVLDWSNPRNLSLLTTYATSSGDVVGVAVSGSTVFIVDKFDGLLVLDASNPRNLSLLSTYPVGLNGQAAAVAVSGSTVFVANGAGGLQVLDVSRGWLMGTPPSGSPSGQKIPISLIAQDLMSREVISFTLTLDEFPYVLQTTVSDQSVFPDQTVSSLLSTDLFSSSSASGLSLSLQMLDGGVKPSWLNLAPKFKLLDTYSMGSNFNEYASNVAVSGSKVFLAGSAAGLLVLDASNPNNLTLLTTYAAGHSLGQNALDVAVAGSTVFVAYGSSGLQVLNVSDSRNISLLSAYPAGSGSAGGVAISYSTVFVADGNTGLQVLDMSNLRNLTLLSTYSAGSSVVGVEVSGSIAFVAATNSLRVLDVSDPRNLTLLSTYPAGSGGSAVGVAVSGSTVFVANGNLGLLVLNATNPRNLSLLSTYPAGSGTAKSVAISGSTVFVADGGAGLLVLDASHPRNLTLLSNYPAGSGQAYGVALSGSRVFVANYKELQVLDINQQTLIAQPLAADVGNYRVQLIATDELGGTASTQPFTIRVEGSPRFNSTIATQYAKVGQAFNYFIPQGLVNDPNFDPISFSARLVNNQSLPAWLSFSGISAAFVGNPQSSNVGNLTIVLSATDNIAGSANTSFILMTNNLPAVNQRLSNTFARVNQFFQLLIPNNTFSHPDGLALNYSAQLSSQAALPSWLRFNATSLFLSGQPNATDAGSYDLRIIATDRYAGQASTSFTLSVGNGVQVNRLINSQLAGVGLRYIFAVPSDSFMNPDGTAFSLQTGVLPSWLTFATTTAQFTGTPLAGSRGTSLINVTATDLTGGTAMQSFNLTVTYFPQVVSPIVDQIAPIGRPYQLNVSSATFIDQNGYALTYRAEQSNGQLLPNWLAFNASSLRFSGLPNITQALRYSLAVIATNPLGAEGRDEFSLFAEHYPTVQQPIPDAIAGVDQSLRLTISGSSFSDLDNDVLRYNVTRPDQSLLPNWLSFDAQALMLSGTPLSAQLGNLTLLMTATDPSGGSAQQNFTIIVRYLPTLSQPVGPIAPVREGRLLNYTLPPGTFTDGNAATLYYNATQDSGAALPTWLNFNVFTQHFLGIPASSDVGTLAVRVIADDGQGGQASVSFSFTITPNYPPALSKPVSNSVASVNQPFRLVLPPDTFTDANADPLNYTASQVDGSSLPRWLAFDEKTITFSGTPGRSDTGDFSERIIPVRVTARDDQSRVSTQFNINVQGTSNIALFLQIATPIATIFTGVFAAYQKRALCFNRYKKQRYQRLDVEVKAGEMFEHKFGDMSMQGKKVLAKTPRQLQGVSRFFLSPRERVPGSGDMPSWMVYDLDTNSVRSVVPVPDDSPPELIIQVKDEAGVVHEQFTLRVTGLNAAHSERPTTDVELAPAAAL